MGSFGESRDREHVLGQGWADYRIDAALGQRRKPAHGGLVRTAFFGNDQRHRPACDSTKFVYERNREICTSLEFGRSAENRGVIGFPSEQKTQSVGLAVGRCSGDCFTARCGDRGRVES